MPLSYPLASIRVRSFRYRCLREWLNLANMEVAVKAKGLSATISARRRSIGVRMRSILIGIVKIIGLRRGGGARTSGIIAVATIGFHEDEAGICSDGLAISVGGGPY